MIIIGITGTLGAGKGTVVEHLVNNKNFKHYSVSGYLNQELEKLGKELNRDNQVNLANEIRKKLGADYIVKKLFNEAMVDGNNAVIESIRNPKEAEFILGMKGILLAITAGQETRYKRILLRKSEKDSVTFEEFQIQEEKEMQSTDPSAQNLQRCIQMANFIIQNDSTLEDLTEKIEQALELPDKNRKERV